MQLSVIDFRNYASYVIPAGTYSGIEEVNALGIWRPWWFTKTCHRFWPINLPAIYDAIDELLRVSRVAEAMTISNIRKLTVPLHEGGTLSEGHVSAVQLMNNRLLDFLAPTGLSLVCLAIGLSLSTLATGCWFSSRCHSV